MQFSTFDEQVYLERYPDVALAVAMNHFSSGYSHYIACGFREGRVVTGLLKPEIIDIPSASREGSLFSPAFSTSPPQLFNGQVMSGDLHYMYSNIWNKYRPETEIVCSILSDVVVDGQGLVFDSNEDYISRPFTKLALMRLTKPTGMSVLTLKVTTGLRCLA